MKLVRFDGAGILTEKKSGVQQLVNDHFTEFHEDRLTVDEFVSGLGELINSTATITPAGSINSLDSPRKAIENCLSNGGEITQITLFKDSSEVDTVSVSTIGKNATTYSVALLPSEKLTNAIKNTAVEIVSRQASLNYLVTSNQEGENLQLLALPEGVCFIPD